MTTIQIKNVDSNGNLIEIKMKFNATKRMEWDIGDGEEDTQRMHHYLCYSGKKKSFLFMLSKEKYYDSIFRHGEMVKSLSFSSGFF